MGMVNVKNLKWYTVLILNNWLIDWVSEWEKLALSITYITIDSEQLVSYINCSTPTVLLTVSGKKISVEYRMNKVHSYALFIHT
jgi:hypothetical protein